MPKFQSAADKAFNEKLQHLLSREPEKPEKPSMSIESFDPRGKPLDLDGIARVFTQYGTYLELIGGEAPAEAPVVVTASRLGAAWREPDAQPVPDVDDERDMAETEPGQPAHDTSWARKHADELDDGRAEDEE